MTAEELFKSMQKARELCNEDIQVTPEMRQRHAARNSSPGVGGMSAEQLDSFFCGDDVSSSRSYSEADPYSTQDIDNFSDTDIEESKLPEAIKQSFLNERIEIKDNSSIEGIANQMSKTAKPQKRQVSVINEESFPLKSSPSSQSSAGIDYSIIRAIVKDCLESYMPKGAINESATLDSIVLNKNGQISLVDTKGNVFTAKLQKTGNLNESKRK